MSTRTLLQAICDLSRRYSKKLLLTIRARVAKRLPTAATPDDGATPPRWHLGVEQAAPLSGLGTTGIQKTEQLRTLERMPEPIKILYTQILAAQALVDQQLHPLEFSDLYVFMTQIGLTAPAREQVRQAFTAAQPPLRPLIDQMLAQVTSADRDIIKFSLIKDLLRVSRMDGQISAEERANIEAIALHLYHTPGRVAEILQFAERAIEYDEKLLLGKLTIDEFTKGAKNLASTATGIGVPLAAVYFSGSVIGLSAEGIISGLTALGLGGILGLSSVVTGLGVVVVLGVITFKLVQWLVTGKERQMERVREHMMQEIIKLNQRAMAALAEDLQGLAGQITHLSSLSAENRKMLLTLQELYRDALGRLKDREAHYAEK
jgi:hypothetical protein